MTREMEYTKYMAILCRIYRKGKIAESDFRYRMGKHYILQAITAAGSMQVAERANAIMK